MSKCSRPLTLILTIILSFSFLSVNSFAAEDENLVSPDLRDWSLGSDVDSSSVVPDHYYYFSNLNANRIRIRFPENDVLGYSGYSYLYELPEIQVGRNYQFEITMCSEEVCNTISPHITSIGDAFGEDVTLIFGIGYLDNNNSFNLYDDYSFIISYEDFPSVLGQTFKQSFRLDNIKGTPFFGISVVSVGSYESIIFLQDISLYAIESESEKKLDGILGWLQELWNSITGGFDRIQTKIGEVITNLSSALTDVWQRITSKLEQIKDNLVGEIQSSWQNINTKLGEVITGLTGELRYLGDRIINYLLYLGPEVPENPFKTEESPLTKVQGYIDDVVNYINDFTEDMDDVIDSLSAGIKIFTEFVEDNKWVMILVAVSLFLLVVGRFVGI